MALSVKRVTDPADPRRCQASGGRGQCDKIAMEGSKYCPIHERASAVDKRQLKNYRLQTFNTRLSELSTTDHLKSLNEEIGILRLTLESVLNSCKQEVDLIASTDAIGDLVTKIERLVVSCQKLDIQNGQMLTIEQLSTIIDSLIDIISRYVHGDDLKRCTAEISGLLLNDQSLADKMDEQINNHRLAQTGGDAC